LGKHNEAETLRRKVLWARQLTRGSDDPSTMDSKVNLGYTLHRLGKYIEAASLFREVLAVQERTLGSEHPDALYTKTRLASAEEQLALGANAVRQTG